MERLQGHDEQKNAQGFLQERLWVVLLPALLVLSLIGATWTGLLIKQREDSGRIERIQQDLRRAVHKVSGQVGHAVETSNREHYGFLVNSLAHVLGGRVTLHHHKGGLLAEEGNDGRKPGQGTIVDDIARLIIVGGPVTGAGGRKVGSLRVHVPMPAGSRFPWSVWSGMLAVLILISACVLLLVTRILAPLGKLSEVFRKMSADNLDGVRLPQERFAEFGQLRSEIADCIDSLRARALRAEESFVEVAFSLSREYEYHREGQIGHGQRTRRYASWIADRLRLPPKERDELEVASLCHDIGKMPSDDGQRWGSTEDVERMHPMIGAAYFEAMPGLEGVARIIHAHHENYDGSGFPNGLAEEDIPIGARILRIADSFERLYSEETEEMTLQEALTEMEEDKGRIYDPYLFEFFREEVAVHMLERRRLRVTLKAYQMTRSET